MSRPIFHSLGSNYTWSFAGTALRELFFPTQNAPQQLRELLKARYHGEVSLVYKGRQAIELALRAYQIGVGDQVLTQAFTCHAIEEAITAAGAEPIFVDLDPVTLNPSVETLQKSLTKAPHAKAVLIQHTLGYVADIHAIQTWCAQHQLLLIEDLAQSLGAKDENGTEVGHYGDAIICSFGRDKIIDAVSGGAVILKKQPLLSTELLEQQVRTQNVPALVRVRDMTYPALTNFIRQTQANLFGKVLFQVAKQVGWLTSPIDNPVKQLATLPAPYAQLALVQFAGLEQQLQHRAQLAEEYAKLLQAVAGVKLFVTSKKSQHAFVRYSLLVADPTAVTKKLLPHQIFITDRWYRKAVDSGSLQKPSLYLAHSCLHAEELAAHVLNLPTHRHITQDDVKRICQQLQEVTI